MNALRRLAARRRRRDESGYVAAWTAIAAVLLVALCAFSVDVGNWYLTGQRVQRAADAGALAGVTRLPGNPNNAYTVAKTFANQNGYPDATDTDGDGTVDTWVTTQLDGSATRLRVTVTHTVQNAFGSLFGEDETTITRTAVADYSGPVSMGSPCNEFGDDPAPDASAIRSSTCAANAKFWASVSARGTQKVDGDAVQSYVCAGGEDSCSGYNQEYEDDGYFYTLTVTRPVNNLTVELFDPALVDTALRCDSNYFTSGDNATNARNDLVAGNTEATLYASGSANAACTGDALLGGTLPTSTKFTVRSPGPMPWDPTSFPEQAGCAPKTYPGYRGSLFNALDQYTSGTNPRATYRSDVATSFRRWSTLCTIPNAQPGDYLIQVQTNGLTTDLADATNHFGIRAYSTSDTTAKDAVSISGRGRMSIYTNADSATATFQLARVPTAAAGQTLAVRLFDIGDSNETGTIQVLPPSEIGGTYSGCKAFGPRGGTTGTTLTGCSFTATSTTHQGKWQEVAVPIPSTYTCSDTLRTRCWVRLRISYGSGSAPHDVTTWTAGIRGDPVRLVE